MLNIYRFRAYYVPRWRRKWQPTLAFLPEELHGQRNLSVYSPWGHKESDMTDGLTQTHTHVPRSVC